MRTLLGLDCSGGRNYKTYARHANADSAWLRATVDNRPRNRQSSNRPFARCLLYSRRRHPGLPHRPQRRRLDAPLPDGRRRRQHRTAHRAPGQGLAGHRQLAQAPRRRRPVARHRQGARARTRPDRPPLRVQPQGAAAPRLRRVRRPGGARPLRRSAATTSANSARRWKRPSASSRTARRNAPSWNRASTCSASTNSSARSAKPWPRKSCPC